MIAALTIVLVAKVTTVEALTTIIFTFANLQAAKANNKIMNAKATK